MNVKGLFGNMITPGVRQIDRTERSVRSDTTHDRDANGQQPQPDQQQQHREPMSDEQFEKAMQYLRDLPAVKENKWTIQKFTDGEKKYVFVKDNLGSIIRKIPELELWNLPTDQVEKKGHLFNKSA